MRNVYKNKTGTELAGSADDNEGNYAWLEIEVGRRVQVVSKRISHSVCCWVEVKK